MKRLLLVHEMGRSVGRRARMWRVCGLRQRVDASCLVQWWRRLMRQLVLPAEGAAEDHQEELRQVVALEVAQSGPLHPLQGCLELRFSVSSVARLHRFPAEIGLGPTTLTEQVFHTQKLSPLHNRLHAAV